MAKARYEIGQLLQTNCGTVVIIIGHSFDSAYYTYIVNRHFIPEEVGKGYTSHISLLESYYVPYVYNYNKVWNQLNA